MNVVEIDPDSAVRLIDILMEPMRKEFFQHHLMLIYTGMSRTASDVAKSQIKSIAQKEQVIREIQDVVSETTKILADTGDLNDFGRLLHESWLLKKKHPQYDRHFCCGRHERKSYYRAGALGGKLLGDVGGGFMIFYAEPSLHQKVLDALDEFLLVPFELENAGAHIAFYEPKHYSRYALSNRHFVR